MDRRDYIIIFCLLLPFFITLPLTISFRQDLVRERALTETLRDSISKIRLHQQVTAPPLTMERTQVVEHPPEPPPHPVPAPPAPSSEPEPPATALVPDSIRIISLNQRMREQLLQLAGGEPLADSLRVTMLREVPAAEGTTVSPQRQLTVSFELKELPTHYQGERVFYLVLSDERGSAITDLPTYPVNLVVGDTEIELPALAMETKHLYGKGGRIDINHHLEKRLERGRYRAQVFSDLALVGAVDFVVD